MSQLAKVFASFFKKKRLLACLAALVSIGARPWILLLLIGIVHRTVVFIRFREDILHVAAAHANDLALLQLYPLQVYRQHFWSGIWLLQQTPPLPHFIVKAALAITTWPVGFTELLFGLQAGITIWTACVLNDLVARVTGSWVAGFFLALWFMLSTDLLILENTFYGQAFYENLGMLLVALCCSACLRGAAHDSRQAGMAGLCAALAALTRSSLSYFSFVPLLAALPRWRGRALVAYLAPVLLLQGGWALKNAAVYGHLTLETSSWGGYSAAMGLAVDKQRQQLCDFIKAAPPGAYKDWFVASLRDCPWPLANYGEAGKPAKVQAQDAAAQARLGQIAFLNTRAASFTSAQYRRAVLRYAVAYPGRFLLRLADLYPLFWERIGNYGVMFADPFVVDRPRQDFPGLLTRGFHEKQRIEMTTGPALGPPTVSRPAAFGTISLAPLDAVSIVCVHLLLPLLVLIDLWRRRRGLPGFLPAGTAILGWTVAYGVVMFNIADAGENMRFRLAVEPEIIAVSAACLVVIGRGVKHFYLKKQQKLLTRLSRTGRRQPC